MIVSQCAMESLELIIIPTFYVLFFQVAAIVEGLTNASKQGVSFDVRTSKLTP
jgi:hypothetical protein